MIKKFDEINEFSKIGNKAASLIQMKRKQINIPDGFILDSDTYQQIIADNGIEQDIQEALRQIKKDNVRAISEKIIALFDRIRLSDEIIHEIKLNTREDLRYAVRSSGTKEDLANYSFAGQYETFLNVSPDELQGQIIKCYQSMFSEVILNYLLNHRIDFTDLKMSVIIQEMVPSEYSGICFTINPMSGNDKEMLIEVGEGLGENIVNGKVAPEQYFYNWYQQEYRYDGTNHFLDKNMLKQMTAVFLKIQLLFGYPCDIEFAIYQNQLYILQARKITKIKYQGFQDMWSTADFKDGGVSATICTPYMWSLYEYIWEFTLRKFILDSDILSEKDMNQKLGDMFYARCYWNMSVVKKAMSQVVGYKEREFDSEYGIKINYEGDGETTKVSLQSVAHIIRMALAQKNILKTRDQNAQLYKEDLLKKYESYLHDYECGQIKPIEEVWRKLTQKDYLQSESTYFWQIFINTIHQSLYKDGLLKYVSESDYLTLLGSIENISHLLPFYDMWSISRSIRADAKLMAEWKEKSVEELIHDVTSDKDQEILKAVRKLISDYGYHSDKELDVTYRCYYEDMTPLISTLKDMCGLDDQFSPIEDQKRGKAQYQAILSSIQTKTNKRTYHKIKAKVQKMRTMLWWREEFRDISTRFYYLIRIYTLKLAEKFVQDNLIDQVEDIWFLKVRNIWDYLDGHLSDDTLRKIIERNRIYYDSFQNFMSENEIGPMDTQASDDAEDFGKDVMKGLGANNGKVTGTARVIESFDEIDRLQKDDILITKFTDTGWTSKFAILSGIVTEYGGILCHAAIVSREYGIPAIVSCHDIMSKIKDGQKIMIDGTTGIVSIMEELEC
ncbi:MAG: phosphoenolpyruvate synthase [Clostridia bacterium]|nr:phosphoenolpyruvate synthase [Clostridia bacterium]